MSSDIILRPYQVAAVADTFADLSGNPCIVLPTGAGKTTVGAEIVRRAAVPTLWLAHRRELIAQAAERLRSMGLCVGIQMAGVPRFDAAPVQVGSVQSLLRRRLPPAALIIADEAHHICGDGFRRILDAYPGVPRVGLTATPFRLDGRGLGDAFGRLVVTTSAAELCAEKTLIEPRVYAAPAPDMRRAGMRSGDYDGAALRAAAEQPRLVGDVAATWLRLARGLRTVLFACNVVHSRKLIDAFVAAGVRAEHLDHQTPRDVRAAALLRLAAGSTEVLSNCTVLTEGWDLPALACAIVARPTASLCLHMQMVGRIMRACPGKTGAIVLDHAGNFHRHGRVTQALEYSLTGPVVRPKERNGPGLRTCPACYRLQQLGRTQCIDCGLVFATTREAPEHAAGELEEIDGTGESRPPATAAERESYFRELCGSRPGATRGWLAHRMHDRFGDWPVIADIGGSLRLATPESDDDVKWAVYAAFVTEGRQKGFKPGYAAARYQATFQRWPRWRPADVEEFATPLFAGGSR